jgi:L-methionine (R)-S-oxide reductase
MTEEIFVPKTQDKTARYRALTNQLARLSKRETNRIAVMANAAAMLRQAFGFFWVGFYLRDGDSELVLGPFQGPAACTRIGYGKGVCGTAWQKARSIVVPDVEKFPGHIACSSLSRSEIVVPMYADGEFFAVLDIDSDAPAAFDEEDRKGLEAFVKELK